MYYTHHIIIQYFESYIPISNSVSVGWIVASGFIILIMSICSLSPIVAEATLVRNSTASTWSSEVILFLKQQGCLVLPQIVYN